MTEEKRSLWDRLFGVHHGNEREKRVMEYICHRIADGAHLRDVLGEEYVRRNASPSEVDEILENPRLIEVAHREMLKDFSSGDLDPNAPRGSS